MRGFVKGRGWGIRFDYSMLLIFILFLIFFLCLVERVHAEQPSCPAMPSNIDIKFKILDAPIGYDFSHSTDEIRSLAASLGNPVANQPGYYLRGLTVAQYTWQVDVSSKVAQVPGGYCSYPSQAVLTIGYSGNMTIYVQSEYPEGTCQHAAILAHEHNHVLINRETLVQYLPHFKEAIQATMSSPSFPVFFSTQDAGPQFISKSVETAIKTEDTAFQNERQSMHNQLDSPPSLNYTKSQCNSW